MFSPSTLSSFTNHETVFSSAVCSIVRLRATIEFGQSQDKMYTIGNVILWATGEMACGFFIVGMTQLPKIIGESPIIQRIKKILHRDRVSSDATATDRHPRHLAREAAPRVIASDGSESHDVEDVHLEMNSLKSSESTEQLRKREEDGSGTRCTTSVTTVSEHEDGSSRGFSQYSTWAV